MKIENTKFLMRMWWTLTMMLAAGCACTAFAGHYWFVGGTQVGLLISSAVGLIEVGRT